MTTTLSSSPTWAAECDLLQCIDCGQDLEPAGDDLRCSSCGRNYPIRDGFLDTLDPLTGNNKVAADFYNGPLWPKFRFWEWLAFLFNGGERRARHKVLQHLTNLSGTRFLEVAVGDGANIPYLPEDCAFYGIDISIVQMTQCRQRFHQRDLRLLLGEAEKLPFKDRTFDNALSLGAFNYFNDPVQGLKEMARVVKPGGQVVVCDEVPNLPNYLIGRYIGLPQLDRWVMAKFMNLGYEFTDMAERYRDLKLEPIVDEALSDWQIHMIWGRMAYCIVGKPKV
ncbi:MAG: methyltransferase domain-containing protein [Gemmataceae bacterium]